MASIDATAVDYSSLTALTKEQYIPKLVDNIKKKSVLLQRMLGKSRPNASGNQIVQPVEYADSTARGFYSKYAELDVDPDEFAKSAKYDWAQAYASVSISGYEERVNDNPEKLIDLLGAKMKNAEKSLAKHFSNALYGEQASSLVSLQDIAKQSNPTGMTTGLGGITNASSANPWWLGAFVDAHTATTDRAVITADAGLASGAKQFDVQATVIDEIFRKGWEAMSKDSGDKPSLIVVPQIVFDMYEQFLSDKKRTPTMASGEIADAGFTAMKYRGIDLVVDPSCPAGKAYFINEEYLRMVHSRKANFTFGGFKAPVKQDAKTGHILWMGQLVCSNRAKAVGEITGLAINYDRAVPTSGNYS
tara:strand:- start:460 stop:1542 length:1083 start_codon:yes stop_codon:yes gene_type:complete